jgi:hypothetical protein
VSQYLFPQLRNHCKSQRNAPMLSARSVVLPELSVRESKVRDSRDRSIFSALRIVLSRLSAKDLVKRTNETHSCSPIRRLYYLLLSKMSVKEAAAATIETCGSSPSRLQHCLKHEPSKKYSESHREIIPLSLPCAAVSDMLAREPMLRWTVSLCSSCSVT